MSRKLEPVYLTNVLLYIESIETITTFISVSKRCKEASLILKYYSKRFEMNQNENPMMKIIPMNLYDMFPNIQTIRCNYIDLQKKEHQEIFNTCHRIELDINNLLTDEQICIKSETISQSIREKVVSIRLIESIDEYDSLKPFKFDESLMTVFPYCEKIVVRQCKPLRKYTSNGNIIKQLLGEKKDIQLKEFIVIRLKMLVTEYDEFKELKEYSNIKRTVCYFQNDEDEKAIDLANKIFDEVYAHSDDLISVDEYYPLDITFIDLNELKRKIFKHNIIGWRINESERIWHTSKIDLTKFKQLERIEMLTTSCEGQHPKILIDGLENIKEISFGETGKILICQN